ncbi:hypothetical protein EJB05_40328, partial [Eragrostis curvula]
MQNSITRARKRQSNLSVSSFLMSSIYGFENKMLPNELIIVRNHGDDEDVAGELLGGVEGRQEVQIKFEAQSKSVSSPFRTPTPVGTKTGAQVAYEIGFGCSLYGWKAKKITFPMDLVSCLNSAGVIGNHRNKLTSRICPGAAPSLFGLWACISCDTEIFEPSMLHPNIQDIIQQLPSYNGESFNARAYIDWEMKVENKFDDNDLSEEEKIYIASSVLTENALNEWKRICRRNKVPQSWQDFKLHFRDAFISEYHVDKLLARLDYLKQGSRTVKQYYHEFKICIIFGGFDGSQEDVMNRFMRGLNSEIRTMLSSKTCSHVSLLFYLALKVEQHILLSSNACKTEVLPAVPFSTMTNIGQNNNDLVEHPSKEEEEKGIFVCAETEHVNDEAHELTLPPCEPVVFVQNLSTPHATLEQSLVDSTADFPLLQDEYIVACDKKELCDNASLISTTQLVHECDSLISIANATRAAVRGFHFIYSKEEELKIMSSLNYLAHIKFDFLCDLNRLEENLFQKSGLPCLDYCSFHAIGKYDENGTYMVHRLYICSDLKTPLIGSTNDPMMTCIHAHKNISSFPSIGDKLQVNFQKGERCLLPCALVQVSKLYWKELLDLYLNINHDAKPRTVCSQEGENDEDMTRTDTTNTPPLDMQNSITRARKRQSNLSVSSFLMSSIFGFENKMLPNELIIVRNHGDDEDVAGELLGGVEGRQEVQIKFEAQSKSVSSPFRTPGPV